MSDADDRRRHIEGMSDLERAEAMRRVVHDLQTWRYAIARQEERIHAQPLQEVFSDIWLFAMALAAFRRCAALAGDLGVSVDEALARFDAAAPAAMSVRNVLEHLEDYQLGIGRQQKRAPTAARPVEFLSMFSPGEGWSLQLQGAAAAHLDLQVQRAHAAAQELADELVPRLLASRTDLGGPPLPDHDSDEQRGLRQALGIDSSV